MAKVVNSDITYNCPSGFSFTRTTLPPKIILLRKKSQENHVRRMKFAYKMKEMRGISDISNCLSSSFSRKTVSHTKSPVITSVNVQGYSENIQTNKKDTFPLLPARKNSAITRKSCPPSFKNISETKCAAVKTVQKRSIFTEKERIVSSTRSSQDENKNEKDKIRPRTLTFGEEQQDSGDGHNRKTLLIKKMPSKIPVLISRLQIKNLCKQKESYRKENFNKNVEEPLKCSMEDVENQFKELNLKEYSKKDIENPCLEESYALPNLIFNYREDDNPRNVHDSFAERKMSSNDISLIDKWMNGALDITGTVENSVETSPILKLKNIDRISTSEKRDSFINLRRNKTPKYADKEKDCIIFAKYDYISDTTESEKGSGLYYKLEDADDESVAKEEHNNFRNMNFEVASTITVPSDKDLEVADFRDTIYKDLPDYPDTPYNLRYPRFRFKGYDKIYSSVQLESNVNANRTSSLRNRRKCYSATPKRAKSSKKKKIKRQSVRK